MFFMCHPKFSIHPFIDVISFLLCLSAQSSLLSLVQSSCTKPDLEAERGCPENVHNLSPSTLSKSPVSDMKVRNHEECDRSNRKLPMSDFEERGKILVIKFLLWNFPGRCISFFAPSAGKHLTFCTLLN